jgi:hypothetical protein
MQAALMQNLTDSAWMTSSCPFWYISWEEDSKSYPAVILANLLAIGSNLLAKEFFDHRGPKMHQDLDGILEGEILKENSWYHQNHELKHCTKFQGDLLHVLAQLRLLGCTNSDFPDFGEKMLPDIDCYYDMILFYVVKCAVAYSAEPVDAQYRNSGRFSGWARVPIQQAIKSHPFKLLATNGRFIVSKPSWKQALIQTT